MRDSKFEWLFSTIYDCSRFIGIIFSLYVFLFFFLFHWVCLFYFILFHFCFDWVCFFNLCGSFGCLTRFMFKLLYWLPLCLIHVFYILVFVFVQHS